MLGVGYVFDLILMPEQDPVSSRVQPGRKLVYGTKGVTKSLQAWKSRRGSDLFSDIRMVFG